MVLVFKYPRIEHDLGVEEPLGQKDLYKQKKHKYVLLPVSETTNTIK